MPEAFNNLPSVPEYGQGFFSSMWDTLKDWATDDPPPSAPGLLAKGYSVGTVGYHRANADYFCGMYEALRMRMAHLEQKLDKLRTQKKELEQLAESNRGARRRLKNEIEDKVDAHRSAQKDLKSNPDAAEYLQYNAKGNNAFVKTKADQMSALGSQVPDTNPFIEIPLFDSNPMPLDYAIELLEAKLEPLRKKSKTLKIIYEAHLDELEDLEEEFQDKLEEESKKRKEGQSSSDDSDSAMGAVSKALYEHTKKEVKESLDDLYTNTKNKITNTLGL